MPMWPNEANELVASYFTRAQGMYKRLHHETLDLLEELIILDDDLRGGTNCGGVRSHCVHVMVRRADALRHYIEVLEKIAKGGKFTGVELLYGPDSGMTSHFDNPVRELSDR